MTTSMSYAQATIDGKQMDKEMDQAIDELSELLKDFSFDSFFNDEMISKLEENKPKDEDIDEAKDMILQGLNMMKDFDFSVFEDVFKELEKNMSTLNLENKSEQRSVPSQGKTSKPTKKI